MSLRSSSRYLGFYIEAQRMDSSLLGPAVRH